MFLKPCPFCGNEWPWRTDNLGTAQLGCDNANCFGGVIAPQVRLLFKEHEIPPKLRKYAFPALGVVIPPAPDDPHAQPMKWPQHGLWLLPLPEALMQDERSVMRWNMREGEGKPAQEFGLFNGH